MANCKSQKFVGRDCVLEYAIGCGDELPGDGDWQRLGAMRAKELTIEWETTDATADDSIGNLRENLATFQTLSVSGDGTLKASGTGAAALIALTKHVVNPTATAGQPFAWLRMTFPDLTFTFFALVTNMSRSAPFDDMATYSLEASATTSDFGLIVEDTPDPDAVVTGVTVVPATLSLTVGQTYDIEAIVLPTSVPQGVTWASDKPLEVSVNEYSGVITALDETATTATITATSTSDPTKSGTCVVTVTAA